MRPDNRDGEDEDVRGNTGERIYYRKGSKGG